VYQTRILGMAPGVQVGIMDTSTEHAVLWHGTPQSFEDLHPPATSLSRFYATTGRIHAGMYTHGGADRAGLNFGTPDSWIDLHQYIPGGPWGESAAKAIVQDGDKIYVGGWVELPGPGFHEAVLWTGTVPCWANCDGSTSAPVLGIADFTCFLGRFVAGDGYANCDHSTTPPVLNVADFTCFFQKFATGDPWANCDGSLTPPVLNVQDFTCFLQRVAQGCP
jgi:hypothetical protein